MAEMTPEERKVFNKKNRSKMFRHNLCHLPIEKPKDIFKARVKSDLIALATSTINKGKVDLDEIELCLTSICNWRNYWLVKKLEGLENNEEIKEIVSDTLLRGYEIYA